MRLSDTTKTVSGAVSRRVCSMAISERERGESPQKASGAASSLGYRIVGGYGLFTGGSRTGV